jgi:hypothetical protein
MAGAEHGEGDRGGVGFCFVREPVGVGGGVDAVEFDAEEVGVLAAGEFEQAGGEVFDEWEVVVFVK